MDKSIEMPSLTVAEELGTDLSGRAEAVFIESDEHPAFTLYAEIAARDLRRVSHVLQHRWTGVNSCGDRVASEIESAFRNWTLSISTSVPGETMVNAGHDRPAISLRFRHPIGGKRRCSGTAYIPCWADFEKST